MKSVPFKRVIERAARKCGIIPGTVDYTDELIELLVSGINEALPEAWRMRRWDEACLVEERQFAADWAADEAYVTGDFSLYSGQYWIALQASTGETPADGSAYWEVSTDYDLYIAREQAWADEEIGEFLTISDRNPRRSREPFYYLFSTDAEGAWLTSTCDAATVWVKFRKPVPRFGWEEWSADETSESGDLRIGSDGECYLAVAASTGVDPTTDANETSWVQVPFPEIFEKWALHIAKATYLRDDGQDDKAVAEEENADWALQAVALARFGGQDQQDSPVRMGGYGMSAGRR